MILKHSNMLSFLTKARCANINNRFLPNSYFFNNRLFHTQLNSFNNYNYSNHNKSNRNTYSNYNSYSNHNDKFNNIFFGSRLAGLTTSAVCSINATNSSNSTNAATKMAQEHHKVVIIGSGPAGHTAAIYLARANLKPVMFEGFMAAGVAAGGQLTTTTEVENFPGFPEGMTGSQLMDRMREQSIKFGTIIHTETVSKVDFSQRPFKVWREGSDEKEEDAILADSIVIATGATAKRLFINGEDQYWQAGISACAVCDGAAPIFRNKSLAVVGGGDSAAEEATYLTKYAEKVYVLVRSDKLRASKVMADRMQRHPKIEVLWKKVPVEAKGENGLLTELVLEDTSSKEHSSLKVNGLFYAIGHKPNTDLFKQYLSTDDIGYLKVKPHEGHPSTYTDVEGVFACGDVQDKVYRQAVTAAGSGCQAALDCERWLEAQE